jgi:endoglucanase
MKVKLILWLLAFSIGGHARSQDTSGIFELNHQLGRGVNLGNMFEAPTENEWGNPYRTDYFQRIATLGFQHVRIPIRWDTPARAQQVPPYTIDPAFLNRIQQVVDAALRQGLYVIINMHHHEALFTNPGQAKPRFLAQWAQIAAFFKDYDDKLLFEVLNEPNGQLTPELWNGYFAEALEKIRHTNPTRAVVMGMALYGGLAGVPYLKLPADPRLIVSVHYYNPFRFTHQGAEWTGTEANAWLGTEWKDLDYERDKVRQEFDVLIQFGKEHQVPIHVGEFGAYQRADLASRQRWTTFLARWFEEQGFSWAYWEFSAGFGIFNPATNQYLQPLVDALLHNPLPPPTPITSLSLYESTFTQNSDGWNLYTQPGTSARRPQSSDALRVEVQQVATQAWQVQLVRNNFSLVKGQLYRVVLRGYASVPFSFSCYLGKASDPYTAYSDYKGFTFNGQPRELSYVFRMNAPSDPAARLVFDLGGAVGTFSLLSVRVEQLLDQVTATEPTAPTPYLSPNPTDHQVTFHTIRGYTSLKIITLTGALLATYPRPAELSTQYSITSLRCVSRRTRRAGKKYRAENDQKVRFFAHLSVDFTQKRPRYTHSRISGL